MASTGRRVRQLALLLILRGVTVELVESDAEKKAAFEEINPRKHEPEEPYSILTGNTPTANPSGYEDLMGKGRQAVQDQIYVSILQGTLATGGIYQFADGTVLFPSVTFNREITTGRYRIGTNNVGESVGGILKYDWDASRMKLASGYHLDVTELDSTGSGGLVFITSGVGFQGRLTTDVGSFQWTGASLVLGFTSLDGNISIYNNSSYQVSLYYDATKGADFQVKSDGNLYIYPNDIGVPATGKAIFNHFSGNIAVELQSPVAKNASLIFSSVTTPKWTAYREATTHDFKIDNASATVLTLYQTTKDVSFGTGNFYWDSGNIRLGIGINAPTRKLQIKSTSGDAPDMGFTNAVPVTWHMGLYLSQDSWAVAKTGTQVYMIIDGNTLANSDGNVTFNTTITAGTSGLFRFNIRGAPVTTDITKQPTSLHLDVTSYNSGDAIIRASALTATGNLTGISLTASPSTYFVQSFGNNATGSATADCIMELATTSTGGSPYFRSLINTVTAWAFGANNADSQKFMIANNSGGTFASNKYFTILTSSGSPAGAVGINTTTPRTQLDVINAGSAQARFTYTDNSVYSEFTTDSSGNLFFASTGGKFCYNGAPSTSFGALQVVNSSTYNSESAVALSLRNTSTSPNKIVNMGYDNANDIGFIYCLHSGTAVKPFMINTTALGVNTITPRKMLDVLNAAALQIRATNTDNSKYVEMGHDGTDGSLNAVTGDLKLLASGNIRFGTFTALGAEVLTGYITIKDAGGTTRKVAVIA
jgi:hypothetical protein